MTIVMCGGFVGIGMEAPTFDEEYADDETLKKLEVALEQSSGDLRVSIKRAVADRKKMIRDGDV